MSEDLDQDLRGSAEEALGQELPLRLITRVHLEVKGERLESRVLALAPHRVFLLTPRTPAKVEQSFSVLDIQAISSVRQNQLLVETERGQVSLRFSSDEEADGVVAQIGANLQEIFPGLQPLRVMKKLLLKPPERLGRLQTLWEKHGAAEAGPCGGFSHQYWCACDQMNLPYREEVQWDVDTIYLSQDTREFCLQDFSHLESRDLVAITAALEFNQWFTKLSVKDLKLGADLCEQILRVVSRSSALEELALENAGLKSDFAPRFAAALSQNPNPALHTIRLPSNGLEDKGAVALSSALSKLTPGLRNLDLSKNSMSSKGVNVLAQSFSPASLTHLNLSGNTLRGDDVANLWSFLSQPNHLQTLDLSNSECSLDQVCSSLLHGSSKHLEVLNMTKSVFCNRKGREPIASFKRFFSSAASLQSINLSGTKLPPEAFKALLLGLACNSCLRDVSLDLSSCELRSAGAQILEGCIAEISSITRLDVSDNGLDSDLCTLLVWLGKNRSITHLSIGRNFSAIKPKNLGQVLVTLLRLIQEEDSALSSLSLADSRLKADSLSLLLNALGANVSLTSLDISGNSMGDFGAKMLAKALQINTHLQTLLWDRNGVSAQGLQDVAVALEKNYTIRFMPVPISDAAQALKNSPEKTEEALMKMEQYLLRNHESRRYLQDQAFRLQQGLSSSSTQQVMGQVCVQVQDQLNSLRFRSSDCVQMDLRAAESVMRDARSSATLLRSLYGPRAVSEEVVQEVQEKLCAVAGDLSVLIDRHLQGLLASMLDTAQKVCPHVLQQGHVHHSLQQLGEGRASVSKDFISNALLEQAARDIFNKISEVKLSMAASLSDHITDQVLQSLSSSRHTLAAHLSRKEDPPRLHHEETEVTDEREMLRRTPEHQTQTLRAKRKSIHSRMFRPMSAAFDLGFDVCKALEEVSIPEDLPPPLSPLTPLPQPETPFPTEEPPLPESIRLSYLPTGDAPALQHVTKHRPRRTKRIKASRAAPISSVPALAANQTCTVDPVDEGVPEFFFRKVTNISIRLSAVDSEKKRESHLSGFFSLIKNRSSIKSSPTSPSPASTTPDATISLVPEAPPSEPVMTQSEPMVTSGIIASSATTVPSKESPEQTITSTDGLVTPRQAVVSSDPTVTPKLSMTSSDPMVTPKLSVTFSDPLVTVIDPVVNAEVKGHMQEGVKHGSPLTGRHKGVQVIGSDMLAEIRARQEKRKQAGASPSVAGRDAPQLKQTPEAVHFHFHDHAAVERHAPAAAGSSEHAASAERHSVAPDLIPESPVLPAPPLSLLVMGSAMEEAGLAQVTPCTEGVVSAEHPEFI